MIRIGEKIPNFEFDVYDKGEIRKAQLKDFEGEWLVLAFYPADFSFICPTELGEFANLYNEFKKEKAQIVSISTDTAYVHKVWKEISPSIKKVEYPMGADPSGKICMEFGTYIEGEGISLRATFIINPKGILKSIEMHDNSIGRSAKEILRKLRASRFVEEHPGQVCPAGWDTGDETIKLNMDLVGKI